MDPDGFQMPGCSWQLGLGALELFEKKLHCLVGPTHIRVSVPTSKAEGCKC